MYAFEMDRPATLADAVTALGAEEAQALGGGQTLIPALKARLAAPARLVCLSGIDEIKGVCTADDGALCIGGGTCHADVAAKAGAYPAVAALAANVGDPAVRNRGTIGGSIANNDTSACCPAAVLGSAAMAVTTTREIAADDFFRGIFETALGEGEIVAEIRFSVTERASYRKFEQPASRFALAAVMTRRAVEAAG